MSVPQSQNKTCKYCDQPFTVTKNSFNGEITIFRDGNPAVIRVKECPNCGKDNNVNVPKAWFANK